VRRATAGITAVELAVVVAVMIWPVTAAVMPAMSSYRVAFQLRATAMQFVRDANEARQLAIAQNAPTVLQVRTDGVAARRDWVVYRSQGTHPSWRTPVPAVLNATGHCGQTTFSPTGAARNAACPSLPATLICFDNHGGAHATNIQVQLVSAAGAVRPVQGAGACS